MAMRAAAALSSGVGTIGGAKPLGLIPSALAVLRGNALNPQDYAYRELQPADDDPLRVGVPESVGHRADGEQ